MNWKSSAAVGAWIWRQQGIADHGAIAFGDGEEFGTQPVGLGKRYAVDGGDFSRIRAHLAGWRPCHERRDDVARARRIVVQPAEDGRGGKHEPDFLAGLAQRRRKSADLAGDRRGRRAARTARDAR